MENQSSSSLTQENKGGQPKAGPPTFARETLSVPDEGSGAIMPERLEVSPNCGLEINGGESAGNGQLMENALRMTMNGKPILYHEGSILTKGSAFVHKRLVTEPGWTLNLGDRCVFGCAYCYENYDVWARSRMKKVPGLDGGDLCGVVVRRKDAINKLRQQLQKEIPYAQRYPGTPEKTVVFTATHVDPAPNMELATESAEAITLICENTDWDVRILSKSNLLPELVKMVPEKFKRRMILGVSTGTLEDDLAKSFEKGSPLVSQRIESLHWLQDNGYRTFGMICPSLPMEGDQEVYDKFSKDICEAIRVDQCEHVWAEVLNTRKYSGQDSTTDTIQALRDAGYNAEADTVERIFTVGNETAWDDYARKTFEAHTKKIPPDKLRFLQYPSKEAASWWKEREAKGAILLKNDEPDPEPIKNGQLVAAPNFGEALRKSIVPYTELTKFGIPEREPVLGNWLMEGDLGFVFAERGAGKTMLSLGMATAIATGTACGPWKAHKARKVLYVDGEMPAESTENLLRGMGANENLFVLNHEPLFHIGGQTLNLALPSVQDELMQYLLAEEIEVLFLDNLSCLFSGVRENEGDAWEPVKSWLLKLRRNRIGVVFVHHAGRNGEMRGTSKREDDTFWIIRLENLKEDKDKGARFNSKFTKCRNTQTKPAPLEWRFLTNAEGKTSITTTAVHKTATFREIIEAGETKATAIADNVMLR